MSESRAQVIGLVAVLLVAVLCGCGSSSSPSDAGPPKPLSYGFNGTWGGPAQAVFSKNGTPTGSYGYTTVLSVGVADGGASVSGVCPDGSGGLVLTGSDTSAAYSGSLTCPGIVISSCQSVEFSYTGASLTLTTDGGLSFKGMGSASGCGLSYGLENDFAGIRSAPTWDLRFKGIGQGPLTGHTLLGGAVMSGGENVFTWTGWGLMTWGLLGDNGSFLVGSLYDPAQTRLYNNTLWSLGAECPENLAQALAANYVITGLYGDPNRESSFCTILGTGAADAGPTLQYLTEEGVPPGHILDQLTSSSSGRSYVVTAIFETDAGLYTYVAESLGQLSDGGYEAFDTVIESPSVADLASEAANLADAGYVITASDWQGGANYTLVGTRPINASATHSTITMMTDDVAFLGEVISMLDEGFVPVSLTQGDFSTLADGGITSTTWLIIEK